MKIGGLLKFSLIDYPAKIAAVIFTQGCNYRCPYCHNSELVLPELFNPSLNEDEVFAFLKKRQDRLEGVVITGGEPTIHNDLPVFLKKVKEMDYSVKLDTNGSNPEMLKELIDGKLVDYIAMDIKAPLDKYKIVAGIDNCEETVKESIEMIISSGIDHEFRTTLAKSLINEDDIKEMAEMVSGCKQYRLQKFVARDTNLNEAFRKETDNFSEEKIIKLNASLSARI